MNDLNSKVKNELMRMTKCPNFDIGTYFSEFYNAIKDRTTPIYRDYNNSGNVLGYSLQDTLHPVRSVAFRIFDKTDETEDEIYIKVKSILFSYDPVKLSAYSDVNIISMNEASINIPKKSAIRSVVQRADDEYISKYLKKENQFLNEFTPLVQRAIYITDILKT